MGVLACCTILFVSTARQEGTHHQQPLTSIPKDLEKKLDSIVDTNDNFDLNKKFG